jgi:hypothetical protein
MAYAGLSGRPDANYLRLSKLVEGRVGRDVHLIEREGLLVRGSEATLQIPGRGGVLAVKAGRLGQDPLSMDRGSDCAARSRSKFKIGDQEISTIEHGVLAIQLWVCPRCEKRRRVLFLGDDGVFACSLSRARGTGHFRRVTDGLDIVTVKARARPSAPLRIKRGGVSRGYRRFESGDMRAASLMSRIAFGRGRRPETARSSH